MSCVKINGGGNLITGSAATPNLRNASKSNNQQHNENN
jgi:hypothetical protein